MKHNPGIGATDDLSLRVSVATLVRVVFPTEHNNRMLALERKATFHGREQRRIVWAQPFGGAVRIDNSSLLNKITDGFHFDGERSRAERDFRILIRPSDWEPVKQFCLEHLGNPNDTYIEPAPYRELVEEFAETIHVNLQSDQYDFQPMGFVIENNPVRTDNAEICGQLTVRLYRIFEARIVDETLCKRMLAASQLYSDRDLGLLAQKDFQNGGRGRANSILTLPLNIVTESYLALAPEMRYRKIVIENHELDESVLAVLEGIDVPQYQRL